MPRSLWMVIPDPKTFRTFDSEIPNCRAILAGEIPALKAERTTFT